jgi:hypothetical protein
MPEPNLGAVDLQQPGLGRGGHAGRSDRSARNELCSAQHLGEISPVVQRGHEQ